MSVMSVMSYWSLVGFEWSWMKSLMKSLMIDALNEHWTNWLPDLCFHCSDLCFHCSDLCFHCSDLCFHCSDLCFHYFDLCWQGLRRSWRQ